MIRATCAAITPALLAGNYLLALTQMFVIAVIGFISFAPQKILHG